MASSEDLAPFDCLLGLGNLLCFPLKPDTLHQCPERLKEDAGVFANTGFASGRGQELASGCSVPRSSHWVGRPDSALPLSSCCDTSRGV